MEQGRLAAAYALGEDAASMSQLLPIGIYRIPEISYLGRTAEEPKQPSHTRSASPAIGSLRARTSSATRTGC